MTEEHLTPAYLRDYIERERANNGTEPHPILAELDDEVARQAVAKVILAYDMGVADDYSSFEETPLYRLVKGYESGMSMAEDVDQGNLSGMSYREGVSDGSLDMSAFRVIEEMESLWRDYPTFQAYLYGPTPPEGPTGVGKTDFAYTLIEIGERVYPDLSIASNNQTDEFETIQSWTDLEEWLKSEDGKKVFLLDEAAQVMQFADMTAGKVVSKLLKLLRKYQGNLILIGHTGRDVPRDVRRQLLVVRKESEKEATIGVGLEEQGEEIRVKDVYMRLSGIPTTRVSYNTLDEGEFDFDGLDEDDDAGGSGEVAECAADGCRATSEQYTEVAETGFCPYHDESDLSGAGSDDDKPHRSRGEDGEDHTEPANDDVDELIDELARQAGVERGEVDEVVVEALKDTSDETDD